MQREFATYIPCPFWETLTKTGGRSEGGEKDLGSFFVCVGMCMCVCVCVYVCVLDLILSNYVMFQILLAIHRDLMCLAVCLVFEEQ